MKLKEPLQGIKMISGHIITHFAMFIIARRINVESYKNLDTRNADYEIRVDEYQTFTYIKYGHLLTGIL